jgi:hypothetical protein
MKIFLLLLLSFLFFTTAQAAFIMHPPAVQAQTSGQKIKAAISSITHGKSILNIHSKQSGKKHINGLIGIICLASAILLPFMLIPAVVFGLMGCSPNDKYRTLGYITVAIPLVLLTLIFVYLYYSLNFTYYN